jgi:hypothetical protein
MEKRIMGIILSIVGIGGLIAAFLFLTGLEGSDHVVELLACGVLGAIVFFAGIRLVPDGNATAAAVREEKRVGAGYEE